MTADSLYAYNPSNNETRKIALLASGEPASLIRSAHGHVFSRPCEKAELPDSLGDYAEMLPVLDIGEALVVGDVSLLPSRIRVAAPNLKPRSATIDFWDEWSKESTNVDISAAIEALRKQSK